MAAWLTIPGFATIIAEASFDTLFWTFFWGILWGVGGLMYGLGMPGCETVKQISELATFTELMMDPIRKLIAASKNTSADAFLKLHTLWSTLHGLISINMMGRENSRDEMKLMVLKDFMIGFISGIKG